MLAVPQGSFCFSDFGRVIDVKPMITGVVCLGGHFEGRSVIFAFCVLTVGQW